MLENWRVSYPVFDPTPMLKLRTDLMTKINEDLEEVKFECVPHACARPNTFNKVSRALGCTEDLAEPECDPNLILLYQILLLAKRVEELERKLDK